MEGRNGLFPKPLAFPTILNRMLNRGLLSHWKLVPAPTEPVSELKLPLREYLP